MEGILRENEAHTDAEMSKFEDIQFSSRALNVPSDIYHVYRAPGDYVEVKANSATEAIAQSEIEEPYKVEKHLVHKIPVLTGDMLVSEELAAKAEEEVAAEIAADAADVVPEEGAAEGEAVESSASAEEAPVEATAAEEAPEAPAEETTPATE